MLGKSWCKQTVVLSDYSKSFLSDLAQKEKLPHFAIPKLVGSRFSVFTAVGLLPLAFAREDLEELLKGANKAKPEKAFDFAKIQASEYLRGKNISTLCLYANALESLGKWYEQLLAESIGKSSKIGLTPQIALGASAQHSQLQLWRDAPYVRIVVA